MAQLDEKSLMLSIKANGRTGKSARIPAYTLGLARLAACLVPLLMAGCSSYTTALNPVHWFDWAFSDEEDDGAEQSIAESPSSGGAGGSSRAAHGLVGDGVNSGYAAPVSRDVSETKPLVKRPANGNMVVAAASVSTEGPPVQAPSMVPPDKPNLPATVALTGKGSLMDHYHQRLQESASNTLAAKVPSSDGTGGGVSSSGSLHLNPPKSAAGSAPGSSFQIATLNFAQGSSELSPSDLESLRDVARLYKKFGGHLRVLGLSVGNPMAQSAVVVSAKSLSATSSGRAEVVARELVRLGVPGARILVGAVAPGVPRAADGAAARIYLDL